MKQLFILILLTSFLSGCMPARYANTINENRVETHFSSDDYQAVLDLANQYCSNSNKIASDILLRRKGCLLKCENEYNSYSFKCTAPIVDKPPIIVNEQNTIEEKEKKGLLDIEQAKLECEKLGYTSGTEEFGDCVLGFIE
jgi:hypothetical protein